MKTDELLELLDIESPDQFEYFEHLAELMECAEEISFPAFCEVLMEVEQKTLTDLLETYFEDVLSGIPEEAMEFHTLMETIRQNLLGLSLSAPDSDQRRFFADELYRFRSWYVFDSAVSCKSKSGGVPSVLPVVEALALYRLEKLGEQPHIYDFEGAMDYTLDEYSVAFPYSVEEGGSEEDMEEEDEDDDNTLIDKLLPVIDGEFSDDEESEEEEN